MFFVRCDIKVVMVMPDCLSRQCGMKRRRRPAVGVRRESAQLLSAAPSDSRDHHSVEREDRGVCDAHQHLLRHPEHSKESISHLMVYRAFPQVGAVIHAHPFNLMAFCAAEKAPKPLNLGAAVYGEMAILANASLYSAEQGTLLVAVLEQKQSLMTERAAAVLLPKHGIFVAGKNLNTTLDCLERMENSAYCNLMAHLIV